MFPPGSTEINTTYLPLVLSWALTYKPSLHFSSSTPTPTSSITTSPSPTTGYHPPYHSHSSDSSTPISQLQKDVSTPVSAHSTVLLRLSRVKSRPSVKSDLFDWATFVYILMTGKEPERDPENAWKDVPGQIHEREYPLLDERYGCT